MAMARALGLKKPSVCRMLGNLRDLGLVDKDAYGAAFLTPAGRDPGRALLPVLPGGGPVDPGGVPHSGDLEGPVCALLLELPEESLRRFQLRGRTGGTAAVIKITLQIDGMMCGMCEAHVNDAIRRECPRWGK